MIEQKSALEFEALRRATEQNDVELLTSFYTDDAEACLMSKGSPPSSPFELHGKEAIAEYLRDACSWEVKHRIQREVVGEDRIAFNELCEYPDGTRVLAATTLEVKEGKIYRQVTVEAWDEQLGSQVQGGKTMRGSREDVPVTIEADEAVIREAEWGEIHVGFETYHEEFDITPLLKGLPDNMCQCPHYGYVLKGRMRVRYPNGEEVVNAGDAYYIAPGHAPIMEAGTEIVEFSPKKEYQKTMEVAERNFVAMQESQ